MTEKLLEKYNMIVSAFCDGIVLVKAETGQIVACNEQYQMLARPKSEELIGTRLWETVPRGLADQTKSIFDKMLSKDKVTGRQYYVDNNSEYYIEYYSQKFNLNGVTYIQIVIKDITEWMRRERFFESAIKRYKDKLRKSALACKNSYAQLNGYRYRLREITNEYINAQEAERKLVAVELHDRVVQDLVSLCHHINNFKKSTTNADHIVIENLLEKAKNTLTSTRNVMKTLYTTALERYGLIETVKQELSDFEALSNVCTKFESSLSFKLDPTIEITLYRIFHESLLNIEKHSHYARNVTVVIKREKEYIEMRIMDDGIGFDINKISVKEPRGLEFMKHRAILLGGYFNITSCYQKGTEIFVKIPIDCMSV
ncbi:MULTISPECIES: ATP-binding protein [Dehalococcoides]|uniref:sensor histidine kinase n=1 Tax=Dehalococcoides TaxID=61434 RepID=UPI0002B769DE|nr:MULTISPECIES: ATP-binding protein [Dehalococcoides]AGG05747.1 PAS domain signal transduction histidine kinase [Dehalococcoides mccartyi DCMB5]BEL00218.1 hypothetical protein DMOBY_00710 [Dehalococcoides mccartyi]